MYEAETAARECANRDKIQPIRLRNPLTIG